MAEYPEAVKNFLTLNDGVDKVLAAHPNDRADEISAIQTFAGASGSPQSYNTSILTMLKNYIKGCLISYSDTDEIDVAAGEVMITNSTTGRRLRVNTDAVTANESNLDTGASFGVSSTYYVYLCAETSGANFTVVISLDDTTPDGYTYYKKIGSFQTDGSGDIIENSVLNTDGTNEVSQALRKYSSGWFACATGSETLYTKNHNLGTKDAIFKLYGATDSSGANMGELILDGEGNDGGLQGITTTQVSIRLSGNDKIMVDNTRTAITHCLIIGLALS